jgi:hypothetical protein
MPRIQRFTLGLTLLNLVLFILLILSHASPALARQTGLPVLRGRGLEIVDAQGRIRASISIMPPSRPDSGSSETVLLRLITERGRPSVKIGSSESHSGLSFAGPTGTSETYVVLKAEGTSAQLKLRAEDGREQVIKP